MRRVKYKSQERAPVTEKFLGLFPSAFELRDEDKGALSVTWLEKFGGSHSANVRSAINIISKCMQSNQSKAVFAVAQVGKIKEAAKRHSNTVRVVYAPSECNNAHAQIRRLAEADASLLDLLASEIFDDVRDFNGKPV